MIPKLQYVPWGYLADWRCIRCGDCCRLYSVVIDFHEWLRIVKSFGVEQTAPGLDKLFIRKKPDGSCVFLCQFPNTFTCGLQYMKPKACQIWPFKILTEPKFGYPNEARYHCVGNDFYVYADPMCSGLKYGMPTWEFTNSILKEFAEIAMGLRVDQHRTTARTFLPKPEMNFADRYVRIQ